MQTADVVLYDRLVSDDILQLVHGGARMVYVGKQAGYHTRTQVRGGVLAGNCMSDSRSSSSCSLQDMLWALMHD
jgi:siroheme synthase